MKKIRNINYIQVAVAMFLLLFTACDLDLEPTDSIDDSKAFETIEDLAKGMNGVYAMYRSHASVGNGDIASDDLRYSQSNTGQGLAVHNWTYNASNTELDDTWYENAKLVDRANRIFEQAQYFDVEDETVKRVMAEAIFTRAYAIFEMLRVYCPNYSSGALGTPYPFKSEISSPERLPQKEVYEYLLADIETALPNLTVFGSTNSINEDGAKYYWITQSAAYALKARILQYMGDWDGAIAAADMAVSSGNFILATADQLGSVWEDAVEDGVEVIFSLRRENSTLGEYYTRTTNGDIFYHPSNDLMEIYEEGDIRSSLYFGQNEDSRDIVIKHDGRDGGNTNVVDLKVFRVAEMMLIKAEAYIEKGDYTEAKALITELRQNRFTTDEVPEVDMSTKQLAIEAFRAERRRELAYEGHRFFDLRRWELGINRLDEDVLGTSQTLQANDYRFVFPIPQNEIFANDNMKQNEGYTN